MYEGTHGVNVTLWDSPQDAKLETLYCIWMQSRADGTPFPTPNEVRLMMELMDGVPHLSLGEQAFMDSRLKALGFEYDTYQKWVSHFHETVQEILDGNPPITKNIYFTFLLEGVPIFLREQIVRHQIGTKFDGKIGADIIPELEDSGFWCQTMRQLPLDQFADQKRYYVPNSVKEASSETPYGTESVEHHYHRLMHQLQEFYKWCIQAGIPREDARDVLPLAVTHRMTWTLNLKAIFHIIGQRSCWIAQRNVWTDVIEGVVSELREYSPFFSHKISDPPCFKRGTWAGCPYQQINSERVTGQEDVPPCPLWLHHHQDVALKAMSSVKVPNWMFCHSDYGRPVDNLMWAAEHQRDAKKMAEDAAAFKILWNRDPVTGEPLAK